MFGSKIPKIRNFIIVKQVTKLIFKGVTNRAKMHTKSK